MPSGNLSPSLVMILHGVEKLSSQSRLRLLRSQVARPFPFFPAMAPAATPTAAPAASDLAPYLKARVTTLLGDPVGDGWVKQGERFWINNVSEEVLYVYVGWNSGHLLKKGDVFKPCKPYVTNTHNTSQMRVFLYTYVYIHNYEAVPFT